MLGGAERRGCKLLLDELGQPADVLVEQRPAGRNRARVADRVAIALLDLGCRHEDVVDDLCDRAVGRARNQPRLTRERLDRLERQTRSALVAHRDEYVRLRPETLDEVERLRGRAAGERRVEGGSAAGEEDTRALRKAAVADALWNLA